MSTKTESFSYYSNKGDDKRECIEMCIIFFARYMTAHASSVNEIKACQQTEKGFQLVQIKVMTKEDAWKCLVSFSLDM